MDVLTDFLDSVRLRSVVHGRLELTAPWGARLARTPHAYFYVVDRGECRLEIDDEPPLRLQGGDLVLLNRGPAHTIRDSPTSPTLSIDALAELPTDAHGLRRCGGGGALTAMIVGCFTFEGSQRNRLVQALPPIVHVRGQGPTRYDWLQAALQFVTVESGTLQPGGPAVVSRLMDILFIQGIRAHLDASKDVPRGWVRALRDPQIAPALAALHEHPERRWTVEAVSAEAAMSRSAFAARFSQLVGEPPLQYLTRWRMHKAAELLRTGSSIGEVSLRVGYEAEAAFSKAFKRWFGASPGAYRANGAQADRSGGVVRDSRAVPRPRRNRSRLALVRD